MECDVQNIKFVRRKIERKNIFEGFVEDREDLAHFMYVEEAIVRGTKGFLELFKNIENVLSHNINKGNNGPKHYNYLAFGT